ncbi:MAG: hypothetical protein HQK96_03770 [Nitrospirae bacterium]|nr:hypothetical protein [Nitrospirota bacterium]
MEKFLSIFTSFNAGDMITCALNFIHANPFMVLACMMTLAFFVLCILYGNAVIKYRHATVIAKGVVERANQAELMQDVTKKSWENAEADYKKSMIEFVSTLKAARSEYEAEHTKREHIYNGQMQLLRDEIKTIKDEDRRLAMAQAVQIRGTGAPTAEVIECAIKMYKFYTGKI